LLLAERILMSQAQSLNAVFWYGKKSQ
jgi:hypothetical protein